MFERARFFPPLLILFSQGCARVCMAGDPFEAELCAVSEGAFLFVLDEDIIQQAPDMLQWCQSIFLFTDNIIILL